MLFYSTVAIIAILATVCHSAPQSREAKDKPYRVICYWSSWASYRSGDGLMEPEKINPNICTHIYYGFAMLAPNNSLAYIEHDLDLGDTDYHSGLEWGRGMYRRINHLRDVNPDLKTMISIGGWNEGSTKYSKMAASSDTRKAFVDSVLIFLETYKFDGLDLDWEYPGSAAEGNQDRVPGDPNDKENYIKLLKELSDAIRPKYLLTAAVSAGNDVVDRGYLPKEMNDNLDWINVMTYDLHGAWDNKTGHVAPLHAKPGAEGRDLTYTVEYAIDYWIKLGADPKKMNMGIPTYGRTFTLATASDHGLGAKVIGTGGHEGQITHQPGMIGYNEICLYLNSKDWTVYRDDDQKIPYTVNGDQWIGYDDEQSVKDKLTLLKDKGLGGAVVYALDTDDFGGHCGGKKFPIVKTISVELNDVNGEPDPVIEEVHVTSQPQSSTTPGPSQETTEPTTGTTQSSQETTQSSQETTQSSQETTEPSHETTTTSGETTTQSSGDFKCTSVGMFADPKDNTIFHQCVDIGKDKYKDYVLHCPAHLVFDDKLHICRNPL